MNIKADHRKMQNYPAWWGFTILSPCRPVHESFRCWSLLALVAPLENGSGWTSRSTVSTAGRRHGVKLRVANMD
jgi:hypothetical protein